MFSPTMVCTIVRKNATMPTSQFVSMPDRMSLNHPSTPPMPRWGILIATISARSTSKTCKHTYAVWISQPRMIAPIRFPTNASPQNCSTPPTGETSWKRVAGVAAFASVNNTASESTTKKNPVENPRPSTRTRAPHTATPEANKTEKARLRR